MTGPTGTSTGIQQPDGGVDHQPVVNTLRAGELTPARHRRGFGLRNEIAHRAIHLSVVLGLCFLVFPRQRRLPGPWEWTVSIGLVSFYLLLGWGLLRELNDPVPPLAQAAFMAVLMAIAGLSLPFKVYDGSHQHIPWRDWIFAALASRYSLHLHFFP